MSLFGKPEVDEYQQAKEFEGFKAATQDGMQEEMMMQKIHQEDNLTKWQQDLNPFIREMVLELKNQYEDDNGDILYRLDMYGNRLPPLCSDELVYKLVSLLKANSTPSTILSKLEEEKISHHMISIEKSYILDLAVSERRRYSTPMDNLSAIKQIFRSYVLGTMYRALRGFEASNQKAIRTDKYIHTDTPMSDKAKKSLFGF